jgi:predicted nucleic acid-binding protein
VTACVLDASITGAWLFADERADGVVALFRGLRDGPAVVPALWHTETATLLMVAERRHRITAEATTSLRDHLARLPVETDDDPSRALGAVLDLARLHRLTAYDASYLDLAVRRRLPLATRDAELIRAARALEHPVIEG